MDAQAALAQVQVFTTKLCMEKGIRQSSNKSLAATIFMACVEHNVNPNELDYWLAVSSQAIQEGCILEHTPIQLRPIMRELITFTNVGKNTQAAGGCGELAIALAFGGCMSNTADIEVNGLQISVKGPWGKIGMNNGNVVNAQIVAYAKDNGIVLPQSKGRAFFQPFHAATRSMPDYIQLCSVYIEFATGSKCIGTTEVELEAELISALLNNEFSVADQIVVIDDSALIVLAPSKPISIKRTAFEIRSFQSNAVATYMQAFL